MYTVVRTSTQEYNIHLHTAKTADDGRLFKPPDPLFGRYAENLRFNKPCYHSAKESGGPEAGGERRVAQGASEGEKEGVPTVPMYSLRIRACWLTR